MVEKYIILQNTMTPYRTSLFNKLYDYGFNFEILYTNELAKGRNWEIDKSSIRYPYTVINGFRGKLFGFPIYWSPKYIKRFINERDSKIILGGSWNFPDVIVTCILKRIGLVKTEVLFWSEANYLTIGARKKNRLRDWLRKYILNTGEGRVIVPGKMAIESFKRWGINKNKYIILPNVIEEENFLPMMEGEKVFSIREKLPVFLLPVRIIERLKGIMNFFVAIGDENTRRAKFVVMGDGPDKEKLRNFIEERHLGNHILLIGFCQMKEVVQNYLKADILLLPSYSDPSPLSLVEGCCCRLPMLISNRCGNHFETIIDGINGYKFDPDNHKEVRSAFETLMTRRMEWPEMGKESRRLYNEYFLQEKIIPRFLEQINS